MDTMLPAPLLTPTEHQSYVDQLDRLRQVRDRDLPELLRDARALVANDAAEEMIQIQRDQAVVDARIARLEELLRTARIDAGDGATDVVALGRTVEVEYLRTGKVLQYRLAGIVSGSGARAVSAGSPIGSALLGRRAGDTVAVELPNGRVEDLRIVNVLGGGAR